MSKHAAHFAVVFDDLKLIHRSDLGRRADEALYQGAIFLRSAWAGQEVKVVETIRVAIAKPACESGEFAADALRTATAMWFLNGLLARVRATHTLFDQIAAARIPDQIDNLSLGYPKERVLDCKGLLNEQTE
jgi:hypothetical protein